MGPPRTRSSIWILSSSDEEFGPPARVLHRHRRRGLLEVFTLRRSYLTLQVATRMCRRPRQENVNVDHPRPWESQNHVVRVSPFPTSSGQNVVEPNESVCPPRKAEPLRGWRSALLHGGHGVVNIIQPLDLPDHGTVNYKKPVLGPASEGAVSEDGGHVRMEHPRQERRPICT